MNKLKRLLERCKCGVFLIVNEHRDYYQTAEEKLNEASKYDFPPVIEDNVREIMIKTNTIIVLQFYERTPISSYEIWHYDLDKCLDEALDCLN